MTGDPYLDGNFPESFVLGKLDEKERQDFEAHLLDCERCFSEVQLAARYVTAVKALADHPLLRDADEDHHGNGRH